MRLGFVVVSAVVVGLSVGIWFVVRQLGVDGAQQVGGFVDVVVREPVVAPDGVVAAVQQVEERARGGGVVGNRLLNQVAAFGHASGLDLPVVVREAEVVGVELVDLVEQAPFLGVRVGHGVGTPLWFWFLWCGCW